MKRVLIVAFSIQSMAAPRDSWLGPDKVKHFFLGAFVQSVTFAGLRATRLDKSPSLAGASAMTLSLSVAKELRDRTGKGTPSARDVAWGLTGAAAVTPLLLRTK